MALLGLFSTWREVSSPCSFGPVPGEIWPGQGAVSLNCATFHDRDLGTRRAMARAAIMFRSVCAHRFSAYSIECGEELASSSAVTVLERGPPSFVARVGDESASIVSRA